MLPLKCKIQLPTKKQPGSFGYIRKHDIHTGVDLYCDYHEPVYAIEAGEVVTVGQFTGAAVGSPWWRDTDFVIIKGKSGNILYGEIKIGTYLGKRVEAGQFLGLVDTVLLHDKGLPMTMLHIELYDHRYQGEGEIWKHNEPRPKYLKDITPILKKELFKYNPVGRIFTNLKNSFIDYLKIKI